MSYLHFKANYVEKGPQFLLPLSLTRNKMENSNLVHQVLVVPQVSMTS